MQTGLTKIGSQRILGRLLLFNSCPTCPTPWWEEKILSTSENGLK
jgi:hypothetical protein